MNSNHRVFTPLARLLHWLMAVLLLVMLLIGVGMLSSVSTWQPTLVHVHKSLGVVLLVLLLIRLAVRLRHAPPALPAAMPRWQQLGALASHWLLYTLMLGLPLLGWAMQGAGGYPLVVAGWLLPAIAPQDPQLYALLRAGHGYLAYLLFSLILLHLAAGLCHGLIRRDGVLASMTGRC